MQDEMRSRFSFFMYCGWKQNCSFDCWEWLHSRHAIYFRNSLGWDKNKWGDEASCWYPGVHLLKYDTRALSSTASAILPPSFLVELHYGAVMSYFPHLFLSHPNEFLKYRLFKPGSGNCLSLVPSRPMHVSAWTDRLKKQTQSYLQ